VERRTTKGDWQPAQRRASRHELLDEFPPRRYYQKQGRAKRRGVVRGTPTGKVDVLFILSFFTFFFILFITLSISSKLLIVLFFKRTRYQVKQWTMICIARGWLDLLLDVCASMGRETGNMVICFHTFEGVFFFSSAVSVFFFLILYCIN
jgi:hypothetical protein